MSDQKKSYKDSLNLPNTDFPMRADLVKREPARLEKWEKADLYRQIVDRRKDSGAPTYILHDGPPFANGDVHMGTALNKVLKDLVLKSKTMAGHYCPYIPGWDCHGLPIEFKVVKESRGLSPVEIRTRSEAYARKFIDIQRNSFRRLGVFADWDNPYLTLDPAYEADIIRSFAKFVSRDLVYRSKKPVLWSYGAQTALAEAEVEYKDKTSPAIFVEFAISAGKFAGESSLVIWTTTPWTLPANLGVALHPEFTYVRGTFTNAGSGGSKNLVIVKPLIADFAAKTGYALDENSPTEEFKGTALGGALAQHPFLDRTSKVITGRFVTDETGTGAVHVAPGHGAEDYVAGQENGLGLLSPVDDDGKFTDECGLPDLVGQHVFSTNGHIIELLTTRGALLGQEEYKHQYPHCWRSKTPIIFRAVEQFFIRVSDIRDKALEEIDKVTWLPKWGRNRIYGTVESRPDWCISRQRTWGVPLPVFYNPDGTSIVSEDLANKVADLIESGGTNLWFEKDDAWWADELGLQEGSTKCRDTLDVWIDSGSSHVAVLERHPELHVPADLYLEATDQHRGWFQSSLMMSVGVRDAAPYKTVLTHGFVVDKDKKKISKSAAKKAGKPIDAAYYYDKYGADIVRLWCASVDWENEVPFSEDLFKQTTETYRRLRNTLRILLGNLTGFNPGHDAVADADLTLIDRWVLEQLHDVVVECTAAYERFEFRKVFNTLNNFCTNELSALYVDITKDRMYCDSTRGARRRATQTAMHRVFDTLCLLLAPILAYTADEAWEFAGNPESIHLELFPKPDPNFAEKTATPAIGALHAVRDTAQVSIDAAIKSGAFKKRERAAVSLTLPENSSARTLLTESLGDAMEFLMLSSVTIDAAGDTAAAASETTLPECPRCRRSIALATELCPRCEAATS